MRCLFLHLHFVFDPLRHGFVLILDIFWGWGLRAWFSPAEQAWLLPRNYEFQLKCLGNSWFKILFSSPFEFQRDGIYLNPNVFCPKGKLKLWILAKLLLTPGSLITWKYFFLNYIYIYMSYKYIYMSYKNIYMTARLPQI